MAVTKVNNNVGQFLENAPANLRAEIYKIIDQKIVPLTPLTDATLQKVRRFENVEYTPASGEKQYYTIVYWYENKGQILRIGKISPTLNQDDGVNYADMKARYPGG